MSQKASPDRKFMERATSTDNLKDRSNVNATYGTNDFDAWVDSLFDQVTFNSVLDVCCGRGNQLIKYAMRKASPLVGVDLSNESLLTADKRLQAIGAKGYRLKAAPMEHLFQDAELSLARFDLMSCFYGLYYSQDPTATLGQMIDHLSPSGAILIVGPYGENNASLFRLLQKHFALPDLVFRSATTFMEHDVLPVLSARLDVQKEIFVNPVRYPQARVLIDYWRSSTFYSASHEPAVIRDIEEHFTRHGHFIMEKHVMAYLARKS